MMRNFFSLLTLFLIISINAKAASVLASDGGSITQSTAANFGKTAPGTTNGVVGTNPSSCTIISGTGLKSFGGCVDAVFTITGKNNGSNRSIKVFILNNGTLSNGSSTSAGTFSLSSSSVLTSLVTTFPAGGGTKTTTVTVYGRANVSTTQAVGNYSTANSGGSPYTVAVCSCTSAASCAGASYNAGNCDTPGL